MAKEGTTKTNSPSSCIDYIELTIVDYLGLVGSSIFSLNFSGDFYFGVIGWGYY